jgi:lysine-N-methylase
LETYFVDPTVGGSAEAPLATLSRDMLLAGYEARRSEWQRECLVELDRYATNYAVNYWLKDLYTESPNLLVHTQNLVVRLALLRFLLLGHPALLAVRAASLDQRRQVLEETAIEVFSTFARWIEQDQAYLRSCEDALARAGLQTLAHTILLAQF